MIRRELPLQTQIVYELAWVAIQYVNYVALPENCLSMWCIYFLGCDYSYEKSVPFISGFNIAVINRL